jgi:hypothetical protein
MEWRYEELYEGDGFLKEKSRFWEVREVVRTDRVR